jgi:hypothetical protein
MPPSTGCPLAAKSAAEMGEGHDPNGSAEWVMNSTLGECVVGDFA